MAVNLLINILKISSKKELENKIDKYFKERYRRMKEQDEADRKKAEERKAKRAAARAKKQQLTA